MCVKKRCAKSIHHEVPSFPTSRTAPDPSTIHTSLHSTSTPRCLLALPPRNFPAAPLQTFSYSSCFQHTPRRLWRCHILRCPSLYHRPHPPCLSVLLPYPFILSAKPSHSLRVSSLFQFLCTPLVVLHTHSRSPLHSSFLHSTPLPLCKFDPSFPDFPPCLTPPLSVHSLCSIYSPPSSPSSSLPPGSFTSVTSLPPGSYTA